MWVERSRFKSWQCTDWLPGSTRVRGYYFCVAHAWDIMATLRRRQRRRWHRRRRRRHRRRHRRRRRRFRPVRSPCRHCYPFVPTYPPFVALSCFPSLPVYVYRDAFTYTWPIHVNLLTSVFHPLNRHSAPSYSACYGAIVGKDQGRRRGIGFSRQIPSSLDHLEDITRGLAAYR